MQVTFASFFLFICLIVFYNVKGEIRQAKYTKRNTAARARNHCISRNATTHLCFFHIILQTARFFWGGGFEHKMCALIFSLQLLLQIISHSKKNSTL